MADQEQQQEEEETVWTDALIRWDEHDDDDPHRSSYKKKKKKNTTSIKQSSSLQTGLTNSDNEDDEDEDEDKDEENFFDPFADPDPTQIFTLEYTIPNDDDNDNNNNINNKMISISVQGFKAEADETWQSTGLTLWKATHHLNAYILQHYTSWEGCRILELGAGLGVCGILVDRLLTIRTNHNNNVQKSLVCITDGDTEALPVLRTNVYQRNGAIDDPTTNTAVQTLCRQLLWGTITAQTFRRNHGTFDVMIASDIVYAPQIVVPLWETIQILLRQNNEQNDMDTTSSSSSSNQQPPMFILAFAQRDVPVQVEHVLDTAKEFGFDYRYVPQSSPSSPSPSSLLSSVVSTLHHDTTTTPEGPVYLYEFFRTIDNKRNSSRNNNK